MTDDEMVAETVETSPESDVEAQTVEPHTDTTESQDGDQESESRNREAAKYRKRLRDTEQRVRDTELDRDIWRERCAILQRTEVERLAASVLADPKDLWHGTGLEDLLDDSGNVSTKKVTGVLADLSKSHPHWKRSERRPAIDGLRSGTGAHTPAPTGWAQALHGGEG